MKNISIFVSYSWDSAEHKAWVRKLAEDLDRYHELAVTWDGFDLDELSDKNAFMEGGLHNADYVLVIATRKYAEKADSRKAGVGLETYLATGMHWEQLLRTQKSNLIVIQREPNAVPRYLKGKLHIDFSQDADYSANISRLLQVLKGESRIPRPAKLLSLDAAHKSYAFTRVEDVIRINHKNRKAIVDATAGTDFSGGNKIKFELWETKSPTTAYFLALFNNTIISQTIARAVEVFRANALKLTEITVLRPTIGDRGLIKRLFSESGYRIKGHEFTYADYIWTFCIDEELKAVHPPITVANYTDQAVLVPSGDDSGVLQEDSAREFFRLQFASTVSPTAQVLIAPGGMGKTSLCLALLADLLNQEHRHASVVLIQVELLRKYFVQEGSANVRVRSVYDLYELYSKAQGHTRIYDETTFDLAVLCGNLIVIIDGLDELSSLLQERFELEAFLESIETLHDELGSSQFLLTTRSGLTVGSERLDQLGMKRYELLGFSEADWMRYARRRFAKYNSLDKLSEKLRTQLSKVQVQDEGGRVIPFFVDILATILEEEINKTPDSQFEVTYQPTPYPSNNELTDHIVCSVLRREEVRHDLGISVSQVASLLSELVVDFGESIPANETIERLKLLYDERAIDLFQKLSLNPLLSSDRKALRLRYGFLGDYFPVLFLIDSFIQRSSTQEFIRCVARLNAPDSTEFKEVWRYFWTRQEEFHGHAKATIASIRKQSLGDNQISIQLREEARRATSAVLRLYAAVQALAGSMLTQRLLDLFDAVSDGARERSTIAGLCVYGDFPLIDFSNLTVTQGRFVGYTKIAKCKFTNARFMYCKFERCRSSESASDSFSSALFDESCDLGDLTHTLQMVNVGKQAEDAMVEAEVRKFLHCFFKGDHFVDAKTAHMKFSSRLSGLSLEKFDRLVKKGYVEVKTEKHDETYYEIANWLKQSVYRFLVNNYVDGNIRRLIAFVH